MNSKLTSKNVPKMGITRKDPIFTDEDRIAEAQRQAACICARPKTTIHCLRCGNLSFGRKFRTCSTHPNIVYLYDLRTCAVCLGPAKDMEELPIDFETYQKLTRVGAPHSTR
uniref:Uncharacterized protein n=1 Tax=Anopheles farauti TaxID=69004 RepID=A0A1Y9H9K4_9DIPT